MKKKLIALLSLVMAIIMSFTLVACNDNNPGGNNPGGDNPGGNNPGGDIGDKEPTKAEMTDKAAKAVAEFIGTDGVKITVDVKLTSKSGADDVVMSFPAERSGNILKAVLPAPKNDDNGEGGGDVTPAAEGDGETAPETLTYIVNLDTGYTYVTTEEDGKLTVVDYNTSLPAGLYGYIEYMADVLTPEGEADYSAVIDKVAYDKDTATVTLSYEGAEKINDLTEPLMTAYKNKDTLTNLIEDYLDLLSGGTLGLKEKGVGKTSIYDFVTGFVTGLQDQTVGFVLDAFKEEPFNIDIEKILQENGIDVDALLQQFGFDTLTWNDVKARKLNDVIVGAYLGVMEALTPPQDPDQGDNQEVQTLAEGDVTDPTNPGGDQTDPSEGDDPSQEQQPGMAEVLMPVILAAVNGALTYVPEEGDPKADAVVKGLLDSLIAMTDSFKVDALIDSLQTQVPELYEFIKAEVQITKAEASVSVKLDKNDKLDSLSFNAKFAHDYKNEQMPQNFTFLTDNDYTVSITVKVNEVVSNPEAITFEYSDDLWFAGIPDAVVYGNITEDIKIYVDTMNLTDVTFTQLEIAGAPEGTVTFDKATSCIVIKASYYNEFIKTASYGDTIVVKCAFTAQKTAVDSYSYQGGTEILYLPDTAEGFEPLVKNIVQKIFADMGGGNDDNGNGGNGNGGIEDGGENNNPEGGEYVPPQEGDQSELLAA